MGTDNSSDSEHDVPGVYRQDVQYQENDNTFRTRFDSDATEASDAVLHAVSVARDTDPLDLPPLYSVVDPDTLDTMFSTDSSGEIRFSGAVSFEYADCYVFVEGTGTVIIEPASGEAETPGPGRS